MKENGTMKTNVIQLQESWRIQHDPDNIGREQGWTNGLGEGAVEAQVPGLVHLYLPDCFGIAWYQVCFTDSLPAGGRRLLRFACADYLSEVYLNGKLVGTHRGCEDPFSFDVTEAVTDGENRLVVRVSKPYSQDVDGYTFNEIPHRNNRKDDSITPGTCFNTFGIGGAVSLAWVPDVYIDDVYVWGNVETHTAEVQVTVINQGEPMSTDIVCEVSDKRTGEGLTDAVQSLILPKGESVHTFSIPISQMRLWDINDPFLYRLRVTVGEAQPHAVEKNFGFRTFTVGQDGWFYLNGRRILLRCSHTGNFFPGGNNQPIDPALWMQDFAKAKATGFNAVRFISGSAIPEQLDYCDELGLMVYEECYAGWRTENGEREREIFEEDMLSVVKRDRSHACVTMFGTLNETKEIDPWGHFTIIAKECLGKIRDLDETRLVIYSSGRFDGDSRVGSVSNPFSREWECVWNGENKETGKVEEWDQNLPPLRGEIGDIHLYPRVPINVNDENTMRTLGVSNDRPVFVSEFGIGSLFNATETLLRYQMRGTNPDTPDMRMVQHMHNQYEHDFYRYGLDEYYAFPVDLLRESEKNHCRQRSYYFDILRSNPKMAGLSITGLLDHSICGEGLWSITREFKPGIAETMERGFAPLRWCLFVHRTHAYTNRPFTIEGVLANEDVLKVGQTYPIGVAIKGEQGVVWRKNYEIKVTSEMAQDMAFPVFKEEVVLDVPEGRYELHAEILDHATATDGTLGFYLSDDCATVDAKEVFAVGLTETAEQFLRNRGVQVRPLSEAEGKCLIVMGYLPADEREEAWKILNRAVENGARALIACRNSLAKEWIDEEGKKQADNMAWCPIEDKPTNVWCSERRESDDWLYHREYIAMKHPYFEGLPCGGIMDWDYYLNIISGSCFSGGCTADDVAAVSVGPGWMNQDGYSGGVNMATYHYGQGAFILNTFSFWKYIGENPAADRMLCNILNTELKNL